MYSLILLLPYNGNYITIFSQYKRHIYFSDTISMHMKNQYSYSRKTRVEEQKNLKNAFRFMFLSVVAVVLFVVFGLGLLAKFAVFLGDIKKGNQPVVSNDATPPIPPRFEPIPKATNNQEFDINGSTEPGAEVELTVNGKVHEL